MLERKRVFAIVPAAGNGSRMGQLPEAKSKVFFNLINNKSILEYSLESLFASGIVDGICLVVRGEDSDYARDLLAQQFAARAIQRLVVTGGRTRQESVFKGLQALTGLADIVLIHDAARPFCPPAIIQEVATVCSHRRAAIVAVPVTSTVKRESQHRVIHETVSRSMLWLAQTPQAFELELIYAAHETAQREGFNGTDDAELVERLGIPVSLVSGSALNIKITTPEDLILARALLTVKGAPTSLG